MHARVVDGQIIEIGTPTELPVYFGEEWYDCRDSEQREAYIEAAGWELVEEDERPADTETTTHVPNIVLVDGNPRVTWTARDWTAEELHAQEVYEAEQQMMSDIRAAVTEITSIRDQAQADINEAENKRAAAMQVAGQVQTQRTQVAAWVSQTTTTAARADLYAIRDQLVSLLDKQKIIAEAMADAYSYRKANDTAVVTIYGAVLWLARKVSGRILG